MRRFGKQDNGLRRFVTAAVALALGASSMALAGCDDPDFWDAVQNAADERAAAQNDSTPEEIAGLRFVREEEKLARDVYLYLGARWGHPTFANIARSEQTHTDQVLGLLESFGLPDPAAGNAQGVFADDDLQALYDDLVARGDASLVEALRVGAFIEEYDIVDLVDRADEAVTPAVRDTYLQLKAGSENHLRAFMGALAGQGADYTPTVIDQAAFDAILAAGGGGGGGGGRGGGGGGR